MKIVKRETEKEGKKQAAMNILGVSAYYHDSAACLVQDGRIVAAAQEERFTRKKHDPSFPINAATYCLKEGKINASQIDIVAFYDKPLLTFERLLETYLAYAPVGLKSFLTAMPLWLKQKLHLRKEIKKRLDGFEGKITFCEHHESHAASAFFPSPFREAAIITLDGVGEWTTTSFGIGRDNEIESLNEIHFPHSLGLLYSAFTYYTGFKVNSGEYKMMGLAPYGEPKYVNTILKELINVKEDGSFKLNMKYFNYCAGLTMTNEKFHNLFGGPPRKPNSRITQKEMDVARSIQEVIEMVVMRLARHVAKTTGMKNLCLAGGVALNCVANGKILREGMFERIWIQPAAGDAGGAIGAALTIWHRMLGNPRKANEKTDFQNGSYLGPSFNNIEVKEALDRVGAKYIVYKDEDELCRKIARLIDEGKIIGHLEGRMEFGPRALGARSILGDARNPEMQSIINQAVKFREGFRPFASIVLNEFAGEYFELKHESPYMLLVAPVREEKRRKLTIEEMAAREFDRLKVKLSSVPAITHVDYSARIQTVTKERNPRIYKILKAFHRESGTPILINTSFNISEEPIVHTLLEAYQCFLRTRIEVLVLENFLLYRAEQNPIERRSGWECMKNGN